MNHQLLKVNNLRLESLKILVNDLTDEDKSSLLELIYKPKEEPNLDLLNFGDITVLNISVKSILFFLKDIDSQYRTNFSARIYFTGDDQIIDGTFDENASHNEIGVIANCKLVGQILLRLVRYYYAYPDEDDIEEFLQDDKAEFEDVAQDTIDYDGGSEISNFLKFLANKESEFLSDFIITDKFTTEIYNRGKGTTTYETDLSKVNVWTIARLCTELYEERIYERKIVPNKNK